MKKHLYTLLIAILTLTLLPNNTKAYTGEDVVEIAKQYIGVPYKYSGNTPNGFDCSGFLVYVFNQVGISLNRTSEEQAQQGTKVEKADLQLGDLVFFENTYKPGISHAGIYVGDNSFISATSSKGIAIVSLDNSYWGPKYAGARRMIESLPKGEFSDLDKDHFAYEAVKTLSKQDIITGFEDQTFRPNDQVTRAQAAAIINRILKVKPKTLQSYKDVPSSNRFAEDIAAIKQLGVINGFPDGTFRPNETMTRAQMAVIVKNAFKLNATVASSSTHTYADVSSSYWAYEAIMIINQIDKTTGFKTETFRKTDPASRADFSAAIYNALQVK
jgi:hypothetical protein